MQLGQVFVLKERSNLFNNSVPAKYAMVVKVSDDVIFFAVDYNNQKKYNEIQFTNKQIINNSHPKYLVFANQAGLAEYERNLIIRNKLTYNRTTCPPR